MKNKEKLINGEISITREELIELIKNDEDVTQVDTSQVTDFSYLFDQNVKFNQNISNWDVSNGTDFSCIFHYAKSFNQDISNWNVSNGIFFRGAFYNAISFNEPLNNWNVSKAIDLSFMFSNAESFNQPLDGWNVSNCKNFQYMFSNAILFYQCLNNWIIKTDYIEYMFYGNNIIPSFLPFFNFENTINLLLLGCLFIPKKYMNIEPYSIKKINKKILFLNYKDKEFNDLDFNHVLNIESFKHDNKEFYFFLINKDYEYFYYEIEEELFLDIKNKNIITEESFIE